jgi:enoyl-CoA hydratase/carnithine racemase
VIRSEVAGQVARVRFDRPAKKNAITAAMYLQLADALAAADHDPGVRAILLHGSPDCFTSGTDIAELLHPGAAEAGSPAARLFEVLPGLDKPIVAAVAGPAVGIGSTLLLHCDLVYAAPESHFQFPFVLLGIVPEFGSTFLLPLLAGYQRAAELLLLGKPVGAEKACEAGIVTAVVPREGLLAEAERAAHCLAEAPAEALRLTKRLMKARYGKTVVDTIAEESRIIRECLGSPEAKERLRALLDRGKTDAARP